jgi:hypothetical protein
MSDRRNGEETVSVGRGQAHCDDEVSIRTKGRRNFDTALQYSAVDMIATEKTRTAKAAVRATCSEALAGTRIPIS